MIVLPGGMPGAKNLAESNELKELLWTFSKAGKYCAAICAAPMVLANAGLINNAYTCYPGFETHVSKNPPSKENVIIDDKIITSKGPGTAYDFGLALLEIMCGKACPFDAIHVVNGIAVVDKDSCKACGKCVEACPKHLIELLPYDSHYAVTCSSKDKGPDAMKVCSVSCIGCGLCKKNCPNEAIEIENFLAKIDYAKCTNCGTCKEKCPKKAINNI